jgi:hypothetical protein
MDEAQRKTLLYGGKGFNEAMAARPLSAEEKSHQHRMLQATPCHDCTRLIAAGSAFTNSVIVVKEGVKEQSFTYPIHNACYEVLRNLMRILPPQAAHMWGRGRKPMWEIYRDNRAFVDTNAPELGAMLALAFKEKLK